MYAYDRRKRIPPKNRGPQPEARAPQLPAVVDRLLDPVTECLTPDVAERILKSRPDPRLEVRIDRLADKANKGLLSEGERDEYRDIIEAIDLVGIIKAKARAILVRCE